MSVAAIILAAGRSTRSRPVHKLLYLLDGRPLILRAVEASVTSAAQPVIVVVGYEAAAVQSALAGQPVTIVNNQAFASGLSSSLREGLAAVPATAAGAVIILGDMPRVRSAHINALITEFGTSTPQLICVPTWRGRRGNPVLWGRDHFEILKLLQGDNGGRQILLNHKNFIRPVEMPDDGILFDVDDIDGLKACGSATR